MDVSTSVGAEDGGRAVWVSACGDGELGLHFDFATSGFGSVNTRHFGSVSPVGLRSRPGGRAHGASAAWVGQRDHVRAIGFHVGPPGTEQALRHLGRPGRRRGRFGGAALDGRTAGGFGLQFRRAELRFRAIDYGNHTAKQGSRDWPDLRGVMLRRRTNGVQRASAGRASALVAFGWPGGPSLLGSESGESFSGTRLSGFGREVAGHAVVAHAMASAMVGRLLPWRLTARRRLRSAT